MRHPLCAAIFAVLMLGLSFVITTALTDAVCRVNGYYQQGIDEENELAR